MVKARVFKPVTYASLFIISYIHREHKTKIDIAYDRALQIFQVRGRHAVSKCRNVVCEIALADGTEGQGKLVELLLKYCQQCRSGYLLQELGSIGS